MNLHIPITEDLISVLDRVLDKSIVVDSWIQMGLQGMELKVANARAWVASSGIYAGYGEQAHWEEGKDLKELFPFWRRDLWTQ